MNHMIDVVPKLSMCKMCGIFYKVKPSQLKQTKYCSRKCQLKDYEGKRAYNLYDKKFNHLTVKDLKGSDHRKNKVWVCECDCENKTIIYVTSINLMTNQVKSCGCLKSPPKNEYIKSLEKRLLDNSIKEGECLLWKGKKNNFGHGRIGFRKKQIGVHRAAWMVWKGDIPNDKIVCHKCDVPNCINIEHLYLGTYKDNSRDMVKRNRYKNNCKVGTLSNLSKLNEQQVLEIRNLRYDHTHNELAKKFGVSRTCIQSILYRKNWKHIGNL